MTCKLQVMAAYRGYEPCGNDAVRGWRTGRIDRVLAGEFDVVVADS
jgi:hypothetical protein